LKGTETNLQLQDDIIYGPIHSRRLGWSLGVNILGTVQKLCSMNCIYCQYGWTPQTVHELTSADVPGRQQILSSLKSFLAGSPSPIDYVTIAGNGEPTLHPQFAEIVGGIVGLLHRLRPATKLALLSNGLHCSDRSIRTALAKIDLAIMKLDAGTEKTFQRLNNPANGFTLENTVVGLQQLKRCVLQTMLVEGVVDNTREEELQGLVQMLKRIKPLHLQIYSIAREPASSKVRKVEFRRLKELAMILEKESGVETLVY
jgi:wyosine [tRNA(Phe)-imidazoG37] synthetase (radical SAM superfamily)